MIIDTRKRPTKAQIRKIKAEMRRRSRQRAMWWPDTTVKKREATEEELGAFFRPKPEKDFAPWL